MPYISDLNRRKQLRNGEPALNAGELNYQIFYGVKHSDKILVPHIIDKEVIEKLVNNFLGDKPNYQRYNDMVGCLVLCAKEIKRRLGINLKEMFNEIIDTYNDEIASYEDIKIKENSDVE